MVSSYFLSWKHPVSALIHKTVLQMHDVFSLCVVLELSVTPASSSPLISPIAGTPMHRVTHWHLQGSPCYLVCRHVHHMPESNFTHVSLTGSLVTRTKLTAKQNFSISCHVSVQCRKKCWNKRCISFKDPLSHTISGSLCGASVIPKWKVCMFITLLLTGKSKITMPWPALPALMKVDQVVQYLAVGDTAWPPQPLFFCLPFSKGK
jgi:hypothetical protein